jgi:hypothetical protein
VPDEVQPSKMLDPGLVYDSGDADWLGYLEGSGVDTGTGAPAIDPSDYNAPSIAVGQLLGTQTITPAGDRGDSGPVPGDGVRARHEGRGDAVNLNFTAAGQTKTFKVKLTQDSRSVG